jgi:hypothetical protein
MPCHCVLASLLQVKHGDANASETSNDSAYNQGSPAWMIVKTIFFIPLKERKGYPMPCIFWLLAKLKWQL